MGLVIGSLGIPAANVRLYLSLLYLIVISSGAARQMYRRVARDDRVEMSARAANREQPCAKVLLMSAEHSPTPEPLYCPKCATEVSDPLICGDCAAVICRKCGTPLEAADELGMG